MNTLEIKSDLAAQWRISAGESNPAGTLFSAGKFAEADMLDTEMSYTWSNCCQGCGSSEFHPDNE